MERHYAIAVVVLIYGGDDLQCSTGRSDSLVNFDNSGVFWGDIILGNGTDI